MSKNLGQNVWDQNLWDRLSSRSHISAVTRSERFSILGVLASFAPVALLVAGSSGCHLMVNPFTDELAGQRPVTTPSAECARTASAIRGELQRPHARIETHAQSGAVTHGPLYFEDGFEDFSRDDGRFAWSGEDYLRLFHWAGRFLCNAIVFPISAVVTPPHVVMESDGQANRAFMGLKHDPERAVGINPG